MSHGVGQVHSQWYDNEAGPCSRNNLKLLIATVKARKMAICDAKGTSCLLCISQERAWLVRRCPKIPDDGQAGSGTACFSGSLDIFCPMHATIAHM